jgi:plasmid replication initiation protein
MKSGTFRTTLALFAEKQTDEPEAKIAVSQVAVTTPQAGSAIRTPASSSEAAGAPANSRRNRL